MKHKTAMPMKADIYSTGLKNLLSASMPMIVLQNYE
tara:strand:- start:519 stop:626 length:108 start_codon:yes stop_codon:yes gene_type:complete